jgi:hypothetical protein
LITEQEGGAARENLEPAQARQRRDQFRRHCVGNGAVDLGLADLSERQHRDRGLLADLLRRLVGRLDRCGILPGLSRERLFHRAGEPEATAMHGPDQSLRLAVVVQGTARGLDERRDRRVGDETAIPDLIDQLVL